MFVALQKHIDVAQPFYFFWVSFLFFLQVESEGDVKNKQAQTKIGLRRTQNFLFGSSSSFDILYSDRAAKLILIYSKERQEIGS